jgi:hypothetical protein
MRALHRYDELGSSLGELLMQISVVYWIYIIDNATGVILCQIEIGLARVSFQRAGLETLQPDLRWS